MNELFKTSWYLQDEVNAEVWSYIDNVFTNEDLDKIIEIGEGGLPAASPIKKAVIDGNKEDLERRSSSISWLNSTVDNNKWIFGKLTGAIHHMNEKFFQYDIFRLEALQFTRYDASNQEFYTRHVDALSKHYGYQRKLSFSLLLTDPNEYDGGDLVLHYQHDPSYAPKERGTIVFFPSTLLHEVTPVTRGVRYSLVGWVHGPAFR